MPTNYLACPFCYGKNIETTEKSKVGSTEIIIVVFCKDCNNKIDIYPKE